MLSLTTSWEGYLLRYQLKVFRRAIPTVFWEAAKKRHSGNDGKFCEVEPGGKVWAGWQGSTDEPEDGNSASTCRHDGELGKIEGSKPGGGHHDEGCREFNGQVRESPGISHTNKETSGAFNKHNRVICVEMSDPLCGGV